MVDASNHLPDGWRKAPLRAVAATILLLAGAVAPCLAGPLRLVAECDSRVYEEIALHSGTVVGNAGTDRIEVPHRAKWRLEGGLLENHAVVLFNPRYTIKKQPGPRGRYEIHVFLNPDAVSPGWKRRDLEKNLLLIGWLVDGRVTTMTTVVTPEHDTGLFAEVMMELDREDARGAPFALLASGAGFIAPKAWFKDAELNRLHAAMHLLPPDEFARLLAAGAKINREGNPNRTLIEHAAHSGLDRSMMVLLDAGAKVSGLSTCLSAAASRGRTEVVGLLLKRFPNYREQYLYFDLHDAMHEGHEDAALLLLDAGAEWREPSTTTGERAWELATRLGQSKVLRKLIDLGAERTERPDWNAMLLRAARNGWSEVVALSLERGATPDAADAGGTALAAAVSNRDIETLRLLLAGAARSEEGAKRSSELLLTAIALGDRPAFDALLAAGASVTMKNADGLSAVELALALHVRELLAPLCAAGARIAMDGPRASELIELAIRLDEPRLVERAIEDGWKIDAGVRGWPVHQVAELYQASSLVALLTAPGVSRTDRREILGAKEAAPPKREVMVPPRDWRSRDDDQPEAVKVLNGVVDEGGAFLFPTVGEGEFDELALSILSVAPQWRFTPALKDGAPANVQVSIPLRFPARRGAIHPAKDVDRLPRLIAYDPPKASTVGRSSRGLPGIRRGASTFDYTDEPMQLVQFYRATAYPLWGESACVRFVVEPDGSVARAWLTGGTGLPSFADAALTAIRTAKFSPGMKDGLPARTEMSLKVRPDPDSGLR